MIFLSFLIFSTLWFYLTNKIFAGIKSSITFCFINLFFIVVWVVFVGGQYNVGSDYENYLRIFNELWNIDRFKYQGEWSFVAITYVVNYFESYLGFDGQFGLLLFAFITSLILLNIIYLSQENYSFLFFFCFITVSTTFHSQFNILRQIIACYLGTLGLLYLLKNNYLIFILLEILASTTHFSYIVVVLLWLLLYFINNYFDSKLLLRILVICFILSIIVKPQYYFGIVNMLYPQKALSYLGDSGYFSEDISWINRISRYWLIPIYLMSLKVLKKRYLSSYQKELFKIGFVAYAMRILSLSFGAFFRIGHCFEIIMILPLSYMLEINIKEKKYYSLLIMFLFFIFYFVKVIWFAQREYNYSSWWFYSLL